MQRTAATPLLSSARFVRNRFGWRWSLARAAAAANAHVRKVNDLVLVIREAVTARFNMHKGKRKNPEAGQAEKAGWFHPRTPLIPLSRRVPKFRDKIAKDKKARVGLQESSGKSTPERGEGERAKLGAFR